VCHNHSHLVAAFQDHWNTDDGEHVDVLSLPRPLTIELTDGRKWTLPSNTILCVASQPTVASLASGFPVTVELSEPPLAFLDTDLSPFIIIRLSASTNPCST
jgi:hypothetical protein